MEKKGETLQGKLEESRSSLERAQEANAQLSHEVTRLKEINSKMMETIGRLNNKMMQNIQQLNEIDRQIEDKRRGEIGTLIK